MAKSTTKLLESMYDVAREILASEMKNVDSLLNMGTMSAMYGEDSSVYARLFTIAVDCKESLNAIYTKEDGKKDLRKSMMEVLKHSNKSSNESMKYSWKVDDLTYVTDSFVSIRTKNNVELPTSDVYLGFVGIKKIFEDIISRNKILRTCPTSSDIKMCIKERKIVAPARVKKDEMVLYKLSDENYVDCKKLLNIVNGLVNPKLYIDDLCSTAVYILGENADAILCCVKHTEE